MHVNNYIKVNIVFCNQSLTYAINKQLHGSKNQLQNLVTKNKISFNAKRCQFVSKIAFGINFLKKLKIFLKRNVVVHALFCIAMQGFVLHKLMESSCSLSAFKVQYPNIYVIRVNYIIHNPPFHGFWDDVINLV